MLIKPNKSILLGKVKAIRPEPDGYGAEIDLEISENKSSDRNDDFLRVKPGDVTRLYFTEPDKLKIGDNIRARASLAAGPFGGRAIIEKLEKLEKN